MRKDMMQELYQRLASLQPMSYKSLSKEKPSNSKPPKQTAAWQKTPQVQARGQMIGTPMQKQGMLQGQKILLVPMQIPA